MAVARSAYLATVGGDQPHVVPVTYAVLGEVIVIGIDQKPKTTMTGLRRLDNIRENPRVSVLCDRYDDDWSQLWWVRADGAASIVDAGPEWDSAVVALTERYRQYVADPPQGPVIRVAVDRWSGWAFAPQAT